MGFKRDPAADEAEAQRQAEEEAAILPSHLRRRTVKVEVRKSRARKPEAAAPTTSFKKTSLEVVQRNRSIQITTDSAEHIQPPSPRLSSVKQPYHTKPTSE
ncbi:hypothetical protein [Methylobacterium sp. 13MFTsu3.1M2]|uniref:hypothetical protein n=1 Tax=Methylobacterium sp. 13MFTsu3.1M2 TaxID=1502776 RepID=UPI001114EE55|nr:hypothetical protein [Methylobacterium sp. 13MFTsu3.1M2]